MAFGRYAQYYDLLYQDKDYAGEVAYIERLFGRVHEAPKNLLELGCGTGIHAALLVENGYKVHGVDFSDEMLVRARRRQEAMPRGQADNLIFAPGDARTYRTIEKFDSVLSLFHVASYHTTNTDIDRLISTAAHHLKEAGSFIFDFWYGPAVLSDPPVVRVKRLEDHKIRVIRVAEPILRPNEDRVDINYTIFIRDKITGETFELSEKHEMRYFFLPELEALLVSNGFRSWSAEEFISGNPPGIDTWGVCVYATK